MVEKMTEEMLQRYWSKVLKTEGCWIWTASKTKAGYGQIQIRALSHMPIHAHRMAWELRNGPIPKGMHVLHRCDNPSCVNPDHLFLGTQSDNNRDRLEKGRTASGDQNGARTHPEKNPFVVNGGSGLSGEKHPMARLSLDQVLEIRILAKNAPRGTQRKLARRYGVSETQISRIVLGRSYSIPEAEKE